ncbi:MAG: hypothetical protein Q8P10_01605 [bacterium]|nr:hypothetical protein [bacterium]
MVHKNKKKQDERQKGFNQAAAVVAGAVVGAGVAVAGMVALKDEKNRKKVKEALTNVKDQAIDYMEDMQKQAQDKKDEIDKKLAQGEEK